jgi:tetratricopeptide (TPR) repeat protein
MKIETDLSSKLISSAEKMKLIALMRSGRGDPRIAESRGAGIALIGAGCSASAGIPMASGVVDLALIHLANRQTPNGAQDNLTGQKAYSFLSEKGYDFQSPYGSSKLYGELFDRHIPGNSTQKQIIHEAIKLGSKKINWSHIRLGQLVSNQFISTIITTNFDQLVLEGMVKNGVIPVVADGIGALNQIKSNPPTPQLVHFHGSMHAYQLRNSETTISETSTKPIAIAAVGNLLKDADYLLVVGYSGGEEGLMNIIIESVKGLPNTPIFWVTYGSQISDYTLQLKNGSEAFYHIANQNSDDFFEDVVQNLQIERPEWMENPIQWLRRSASSISTSGGTIDRLFYEYLLELDILERKLDFHRKDSDLNQRPVKLVNAYNSAGHFAEAYTALYPINYKIGIDAGTRLGRDLAESLMIDFTPEKFDLLMKVIEYLTQSNDLAQYSRTRDFVVSILSMCDVLFQSGLELKKAQELIDLAITVNRLYPDGDDKDWQFGAACERAGQIAEANGFFDKASRFFVQGLRVRRQQYADKSSLPIQRDIMLFLQRLGELNFGIRDYLLSANYLTDSFLIGSELIQKGDENWKRTTLFDLSGISRNLGLLSYRNENFLDSLENHRYAYQLRVFVSQFNNTAQVQMSVAESLLDLGSVYRRLRKDDEAEQKSRQALQIYRKLRLNFDTPSIKRKLSLALNSLSTILMIKENFSEAIELNVESLASSLNISYVITNALSCYDVAIVHMIRAKIAIAMSEKPDARQSIERAEQILAGLEIEQFEASANGARQRLKDLKRLL